MITEGQFLTDLKELLDTDADITLDTDLLEINEWGSLSAVEFLVMIEDKYGIKVEPFSVAEAVFVEDLFNIVSKT